MIEVIFLLAMQFNSGEQVPDGVVRRLERHLLDTYGGYSCDGPKIGGWRDDDGRTYVEPSYHYSVKLDSLTQGDKVRETVLFILSAYAQHAVAFTYEGRVEILTEEDCLPANAVVLRMARDDDQEAS